MVDVFIIHIDKKALTPINPAIKVDPSFPEYLKIPKAILSCRFDFWILNASIKPPRNKKIFLFENGIAASEKEVIPNIGKKIRGSKAVINKGIASVAQSDAIKIPTAATLQASMDSPSGLGKNKIIMKADNEKINFKLI